MSKFGLEKYYSYIYSVTNVNDMGKKRIKAIKPPLGLRPKWVIDESRLHEVRCAMVRFYNAELEIPIEWIEEYNELIRWKKK